VPSQHELDKGRIGSVVAHAQRVGVEAHVRADAKFGLGSGKRGRSQDRDATDARTDPEDGCTHGQPRYRNTTYATSLGLKMRTERGEVKAREASSFQPAMTIS
jgi:hypothetical protein